MEELKPQDLEELVQELEGESSAQESPPPDIDELLRVLQSGTLHSILLDGTLQNSSERWGQVALASCKP